MKRQVSLEEISDGKLYGINDMVKADCNGCNGCFACCKGMGQSIVLDPFDIFQITSNLNLKFEQLLEDKIELNVVDGIILPNLKMVGVQEQCGFLNKEHRCSIHPFRPSICRLFPLGRYYENRSFRYFLQVNECKKENRSKIKVKKWIDIPNMKENEQFIIHWHYFLSDIQQKIQENVDILDVKSINLFLLNHFYLLTYNGDFYKQFYIRLEQAKEILKK